MKILRTPSQALSWRASLSHKVSIGFVPTMGALHEGHISLVKRSLRENDLTVVSIFVNPRQFGPKEDLKKYPRPAKKDLAMLKKCKVPVLFYPTPETIYPKDYSTSVFVKGLSEVLDGAPWSRGPRHFEGVSTIVAQLFNLVRPTRAYFGLKDYQQVRILEQMNKDLHFGIQLVRCPTVRENDGLAMSSRNTYLSTAERTLAPALYRALQQGRKLLTSRKISPSALSRKVKNTLSKTPQIKIEYIELIDSQTLQKPRPGTRSYLLAAAVRLGRTRLIDNVLI